MNKGRERTNGTGRAGNKRTRRNEQEKMNETEISAKKHAEYTKEKERIICIETFITFS